MKLINPNYSLEQAALKKMKAEEKKQYQHLFPELFFGLDVSGTAYKCNNKDCNETLSFARQSKFACALCYNCREAIPPSDLTTTNGYTIMSTSPGDFLLHNQEGIKNANECLPQEFLSDESTVSADAYMDAVYGAQKAHEHKSQTGAMNMLGLVDSLVDGDDEEVEEEEEVGEVTEEETAKKVDDKESGQNLFDINKSTFQPGETQSTLYFSHPEKKYLLHPQINNPAMTEHSHAWADHFSGKLTALNNENNVLGSVYGDDDDDDDDDYDDYDDFDGFGFEVSERAKSERRASERRREDEERASERKTRVLTQTAA